MREYLKNYNCNKTEWPETNLTLLNILYNKEYQYIVKEYKQVLLKLREVTEDMCSFYLNNFKLDEKHDKRQYCIDIFIEISSIEDI